MTPSRSQQRRIAAIKGKPMPEFTNEMSKDDQQPCINTDREIWRRIPGDFYSPSIHVTQSGSIGIDVGRHRFCSPVIKCECSAKDTRKNLQKQLRRASTR